MKFQQNSLQIQPQSAFFPKISWGGKVGMPPDPPRRLVLCWLYCDYYTSVPPPLANPIPLQSTPIVQYSDYTHIKAKVFIVLTGTYKYWWLYGYIHVHGSKFPQKISLNSY